MTTLEKEIIFAITYRFPFAFDDIKSAYLRTGSFDLIIKEAPKAVELGYGNLNVYLDYLKQEEIKSGRLLEG